MAKAKKSAPGPSHIRARLEYLRRAAIYLQSPSVSSQQASGCGGDQPTTGSVPEIKKPTETAGNNARDLPRGGDQPTTGSVPEIKKPTETAGNNARDLPREAVARRRLSQVYISHMRGVSLKTQFRLPIEVKRSFCKRCDTRLIPGFNCTQEMRNESRGRRKPWADVWVVRCATCGTEKRFPQTERRSKKLSERKEEKEQKEKEQSAGT